MDCLSVYLPVSLSKSLVFEVRVTSCLLKSLYLHSLSVDGGNTLTTVIYDVSIPKLVAFISGCDANGHF